MIVNKSTHKSIETQMTKYVKANYNRNIKIDYNWNDNGLSIDMNKPDCRELSKVLKSGFKSLGIEVGYMSPVDKYTNDIIKKKGGKYFQTMSFVGPELMGNYKEITSSNVDEIIKKITAYIVAEVNNGPRFTWDADTYSFDLSCFGGSPFNRDLRKGFKYLGLTVENIELTGGGGTHFYNISMRRKGAKAKPRAYKPDRIKVEVFKALFTLDSWYNWTWYGQAGFNEEDIRECFNSHYRPHNSVEETDVDKILKYLNLLED